MINFLYTQKNLLFTRDLHKQSTRPELTSRYLETIENHRGHELASAVEDAKVALTNHKTHELKLDFIEKYWQISLHEQQLEQAMHEEMDNVITAAVKTVTQLGGITTDQVHTIFLTGGSTALPGFEQRLQSAFPNAQRSRGDRFSSVASGLGLSASERY